MNKRGLSKGRIFLIISVIILIIIGIIISVFIFSGKDYLNLYKEKFSKGEIVNPTVNLTIEEAVEKFDESFVFYLLVSIEAYNLHPPPLSSDNPKIGFYIDEDNYNAVIEEGEIIVNSGDLEDKDIIITTTKEEAVKMIIDEGYIEESFQSGASSIELIASKTKLATKGYLGIYTKLTGKSVTSFALKNF